MKKKILALLNPNSGQDNSLKDTILAIHTYWEDSDNEVFFQLSNSKEDAEEKIDSAKEWGAELIICSGGDGTLSSLLPVLVKHKIPVAFIPTGSANGFARHFDIPLDVTEAVKTLKEGQNQVIDLGTANDIPFVISCGFAWVASLVELFEKLPTRGVATYVAAAGLTAFKYHPQSHEIRSSDGSTKSYEEPMLLSVTNLSAFNDLDLVSEDAEADDGLLELVVVEKKDMLKLTASLGKLKKGSVEDLSMVETFHDSHFVITRPKAADIQIDGEIFKGETRIEIGVLPKALHVRVPKKKN